MIIRRTPKRRGIIERFFYQVLCRLGIHSDYRYDGQWFGRCVYCYRDFPGTKVAE